MTMRAIWSGTISFGLVSVPVRMYSATESKELRFHFLHKDDLQPIGYDKVRKDTGESVDPDDVVRGFEVEKGRYVPIEDEDLDRLDIELTHSIDILDFVDLEEIDPIYFRKAYYLLPQEGAEKPYRLLVRALEETENAFSIYGQQRERLASVMEQAAASREAAELARVQYREGALDFLRLLDAERTLLQAEDALARVEIDLNTAVVLIYKALGGGWEAAAGI